jgi:putative peptide zinc metalloprotease protein
VKESEKLPYLRNDLKLLPAKQENGEDQWLLFDPVSDKYFKLGQEEYCIISRLKGGMEVSHFIENLLKSGLEVSEAKIKSIILFLYSNNLLLPEYAKTEQKLKSELNAKSSASRMALINSFAFLRFPLVSPDNFLQKTLPIIKKIFNKWTVLVLVILAVYGYLKLLPNMTRLKTEIVASFTLNGMIKYFIAITMVKVFHELTHAYLAKKSGIRVREFGIALILLIPRFYTDITDSWRLTEKKEKMLIDAGGIIVELLFGGLAALLWCGTYHGTLHSIAYYLFAVSTLNCLFFNGNPLMRFDGYYLMSDMLGISNLQQKAFGLVKIFYRKWLLGYHRKTQKTVGSPLLLSYGFCALIYRIFLYTSIVTIVYFKFTKTLGLTLAAVEIYMLFFLPVKNEVRQLSHLQNLHWKRFAAICILLITILLLTPLPADIRMPCLIVPAERSVLYVKQDGFIQSEMPSSQTSKITKGQTILNLQNPFLSYINEVNQLEEKILKEEERQLSSSQETLGRAEFKKSQLNAIKEVLSEDARRKALLNIKAPFSGTMVFYFDNSANGKWMRKGEAIGEIFSLNQGIKAHAYVKENDWHKLKVGDQVKIYPENELAAIPGKISKIEPEPLKTENYSKNKENLHESVYRVIINIEDSNKESNIIGRNGTAICGKNTFIIVPVYRHILNFIKRELEI